MIKNYVRKSLIKWLYIIHFKYKELYIIKQNNNNFNVFVNNKKTIERTSDYSFLTLFFINVYENCLRSSIYNNDMIKEDFKNQNPRFILHCENGMERIDNNMFKYLIKCIRNSNEVYRLNLLIEAFNIIYKNKF